MEIKIDRKRNTKISWKTDLLDDLKETKIRIEDPTVPIGDDIIFRGNRLGHRSKRQPEQSDVRKIKIKDML